MSGPGRPETVDAAVLMPVHGGVPAGHLAAAFDSLDAQSVVPSELVVVVDGPVPPGVAELLERQPRARLVRLPTRRGAGPALAAGLEECRATWVVRADSDDINEPWRIETQLARLAATGADVCAAAMLEFTESPERVVGRRRSPVEHEEFAALMPARNPVNHPTVVFRRELAVTVGGYQELAYLEDYDLWARMLCGGARFTGCPEPLVRFRVDGLMERRANAEAIASERLLQARLQSYGLVGPLRARWNLAVRTAYLRMPRAARAAAYRRLFRS